jgi:DNA processing protein
MESDLFYKIALSVVPGIGGVLARNLLEYCGSAKQIFREPMQTLIKIPGIGKINASRIRNKSIYAKAEKELSFISKYGINVFFYTDADYPRRLKSCNDAPVVLYLKGNVDLNCPKVVSIVGTRNATRYGKMICEKLIRGFSSRNYKILIVSGLAYGIDITAHKWSLKCGIPTLGVLGHGLDKIYPAIHAETARKMLSDGGLVTDFPSGTKIDPPNFIRRNRIIAGLSDATVVVESAEKGGALITADIASSYNRDVFAFPGRSDDIYSRGCNRLIYKNGAGLIQDLDDLEYFMGWESSREEKKTVEPEIFSDISTEERKIVELLKRNDKLFIDQISSKTKIPAGKVSTLLMNLEFKNILSALPGNIYILKRNENIL